MSEPSETAVRPDKWLTMICPICSSTFLYIEYIEAYKPVTCQQKECISKGRELNKNNQ